MVPTPQANTLKLDDCMFATLERDDFECNSNYLQSFFKFCMYVDKTSKKVFFKPFLRKPLLYHYSLNLKHVGEERGIIISVIITEDRV